MSLITGTSLPLIVVIVAEEAAQSSCDSMTDSSSCARSSPARPLLALLLRSFSIRRSAAATRHAEPHALRRVVRALDGPVPMLIIGCLDNRVRRDEKPASAACVQGQRLTFLRLGEHCA